MRSGKSGVLLSAAPRGCSVFFSSRRRHTRSYGDWSSDVCSSDLVCDQSALRYTEETLAAAVTAIDLASNHGLSGSLARDLVSILVDNAEMEGRAPDLSRSEERRVGKECRGRWGRARWINRRENTK